MILSLFSLEVGGVYKQVGYTFIWRSVKCTSWYRSNWTRRGTHAHLGVQILSILAKSYVGAPWRVGAPPGKSWIRHWLVLLLAGGRRSIRVGWLYFQLEVSGVYELVDHTFSWRLVECTSWLVPFSAGGRRSIRVGWLYFQLEVGRVCELVGSIFRWRLVECTSWLVLFSAGGRRSVPFGWFCFQLEVGGVYKLVGSVFSWR